MGIETIVPKYIRLERISLKGHPDLNERWVQDRIAEDPTIVGLGDLVLKDKERIQPRAGRLDILLQDPETLRRYEVEVQLGHTDETHIIRTIEYWDIERKRYPQYDHCAVLIAEDINSRFLNVISLFNGTIPLVAIQMQALKVGDQVTLVFTTVVDELTRGLEEDEGDQEPVDRGYWEKRTSKDTVAIADEALNLIREFAPGFNLKFNKAFIGLAKDGQPENFVVFSPRKNALLASIRMKESEEVTRRLEEAGLDTMPYDKRGGGRYRVRLGVADARKNRELLRDLLHQSYDEWNG